MPRQARLDVPGALHHIMVRGINKSDIFKDVQDKALFVERLDENVIEGKCAVYAWVLMDNHVHLLFKSGQQGISAVMRKLVTWYAQYFNRRHGRTGHLFENRYKSILCDEDNYLLALVRYIHLNPLRAGLVPNLERLDRYPWSGHGVLMGKLKYSWQDADYVLSWFGKRAGQARRVYRHYVAEGIDQGRRPELVGGGLLRPWGAWSAVKSLRRSGEKVLTDERILGADDFVESVLAETDRKTSRLFSSRLQDKEVQKFLGERCKKEGISLRELQMGSRRRAIPEIRSDLALKLAWERGLPLAEIARQLGVSTSAISQILRRRRNAQST